MQKLVQNSVLAVNDSLEIEYENKPLNLKNNFRVASIKDLLKEKLNIKSLETKDEIMAEAKKHKLKIQKKLGLGQSIA